MFARVLPAGSRLASKSVSAVCGSQSARSMGFWNNVEMGPKDPILGVTEAFKADTHPEKVNVGVGAYRDDNGKPFMLPSVAEAQQRIIAANMDMEYAPIGGVQDFVDASVDLAYGDNVEVKGRVAAVQSLSGTGALRLAAALCNLDNKRKVLLPNPTWGNHIPIFNHAGVETQYYRYWDDKTLGLDLAGMLEDLKASEPTVVLLHACAHNPTGVDPTFEQWQEISKVCKDAGHFVLFDNAYQGFASGDTDKDVAAVRMFVEEGHNIGLCQSFAKNFGLYGQRVGCFSVLGADVDEAKRVESQIKIIARAIYSNPPLHGARIVNTILRDPALKAQWQGEIELMSGRIIEMRTLLRDGIIAAGSKHNWEHITNQIGMFSYTGCSVAQCAAMTKNHNIYLTSNGRISMAGVTSKNVERLATAVHEATK